jgi:hypothetical protein
MVAAAAKRPEGNKPEQKKPEPKLLHQVYFKSVGPRTYAAQLKECANGNHMLLVSEGKREENGDLRMTRLCVFSEEFLAFFKMLRDTEAHIQAHPVPESVRNRRKEFWAKQAAPKAQPNLQSAPAGGKQMRPAGATNAMNATAVTS